MKKKKYVVLALFPWNLEGALDGRKLRLKGEPIKDSIGYLPVFGLKRAAKKFAGKRFKIMEIETI